MDANDCVLEENLDAYEDFNSLDENKNSKLAKLELNYEEPMTEVSEIMKKYDKNDDD